MDEQCTEIICDDLIRRPTNAHSLHNPRSWTTLLHYSGAGPRTHHQLQGEDGGEGVVHVDDV